MHKTMVYLSERQRAALARQARLRGTPMAALVREAVDRLLETSDSRPRARLPGVAAGTGAAATSERVEVLAEILKKARAIDRRYVDAGLGLVDCTCLALCEHHRIETVFTYDRRDFSLYRPSFVETLTLVP